MTDIVKKSQVELDPFRMMREMLRWDPFREMAAFPVVTGWEPPTFAPTFDVTENKDGYVFKADVPGVKKEDLEITHTGNRLQIAGKREHEHETKEDKFYAYERQFGTFTRTFTLPEGADLAAAKTKLDAGVLTVVIPKRPNAQAKKIPITDEPKA
jgi:HSP20 family protein